MKPVAIPEGWGIVKQQNQSRNHANSGQQWFAQVPIPPVFPSSKFCLIFTLFLLFCYSHPSGFATGFIYDNTKIVLLFSIFSNFNKTAQQSLHLQISSRSFLCQIPIPVCQYRPVEVCDDLGRGNIQHSNKSNKYKDCGVSSLNFLGECQKPKPDFDETLGAPLCTIVHCISCRIFASKMFVENNDGRLEQVFVKNVNIR